MLVQRGPQFMPQGGGPAAPMQPPESGDSEQSGDISLDNFLGMLKDQM